MVSCTAARSAEHMEERERTREGSEPVMTAVCWLRCRIKRARSLQACKRAGKARTK